MCGQELERKGGRKWREDRGRVSGGHLGCPSLAAGLGRRLCLRTGLMLPKDSVIPCAVCSRRSVSHVPSSNLPSFPSERSWAERGRTAYQQPEFIKSGLFLHR